MVQSPGESFRDRDTVRAWARRVAPGGRVVVLVGAAGFDEAVARGLRRLGLEVRYYGDELAALAGCGVTRPDVVFIADGFPTAEPGRLLSALIDGLGLPVVASTARAGADRGLWARCAGFTAGTALEGVIAALAPHLRRHGGSGPPLVVGRLELDRGGCDARFDGRRLAIGPSEQALLAHLMQAPGRTLTRQDLASLVCSDSADPDGRLTTLAARLRRALAAAGVADALATVRRVGYRLDPSALALTAPALPRGA